MGVLAWNGWLSWFGHLSADVRINRENVRVYFPLVSMIMVSVVLTSLFSLLPPLTRERCRSRKPAGSFMISGAHCGHLNFGVGKWC